MTQNFCTCILLLTILIIEILKQNENKIEHYQKDLHFGDIYSVSHSDTRLIYLQSCIQHLERASFFEGTGECWWSCSCAKMLIQ